MSWRILMGITIKVIDSILLTPKNLIQLVLKDKIENLKSFVQLKESLKKKIEESKELLIYFNQIPDLIVIKQTLHKYRKIHRNAKHFLISSSLKSLLNKFLKIKFLLFLENLQNDLLFCGKDKL